MAEIRGKYCNYKIGFNIHFVYGAKETFWNPHSVKHIQLLLVDWEINM